MCSWESCNHISHHNLFLSRHYTPMKTQRSRYIAAFILNPGTRWGGGGVSGQLHATAALTPGTPSGTHWKQKAWWGPETAWTLCRREKSFVPARNRTKIPRTSSPRLDHYPDYVIPASSLPHNSITGFVKFQTRTLESLETSLFSSRNPSFPLQAVVKYLKRRSEETLAHNSTYDKIIPLY